MHDPSLPIKRFPNRTKLQFQTAILVNGSFQSSVLRLQHLLLHWSSPALASSCRCFLQTCLASSTSSRTFTSISFTVAPHLFIYYIVASHLMSIDGTSPGRDSASCTYPFLYSCLSWPTAETSQSVASSALTEMASAFEASSNSKFLSNIPSGSAPPLIPHAWLYLDHHFACNKHHSSSESMSSQHAIPHHWRSSERLSTSPSSECH